MNSTVARWRVVGLGCADAAALLRLAAQPVRLITQARDPQDWFDRSGSDAVLQCVVASALWLVAGWVAIAFAASILALAPGHLGECAAHLARWVSPRAIRQLVAVSAGFSILSSAAISYAEPTLGAAHPAGAAATALAAPEWPRDPAATTRFAPRVAPVAGPAPAQSHTKQLPAPIPPLSGAPGDAHSPPGAWVQVNAGDSLWKIAARELGPAATDAQIAVDWPYWYSANRAAIGRDPNLLKPGVRLSEPSVTASSEFDGRSR